MSEEYDVVVLGGGSAGETAAQYAAQHTGLTVAVVEGALVGGACSYWACMPSKALLRPVAAAAQARRVPGVRAEVHDIAAVLRHRDAVVHRHVDDAQVAWATGEGLVVLRGHGTLQGTRQVRVTQTSGTAVDVTARHAVVLATGSTPRIPDIPGLAESEPWTSDEATAMTSVPRSIVIIGGGVVGCEAATWLSGLGSEVTLLEPGDRLLSKLEPRASQLVLDALVGAGVDVRCSSVARTVSHGTAVEVILDDGHAVWADEVMVATGRIPRRHDAGLAAVQIDPDTMTVDDAMRVGGAQDWLYAVGDINGGPGMLTHMGKHQGRIAGEDIARRFGRRRHEDPWAPGHPVHQPAVPQVVFTDPEVATVGETLAQARGHRDVVAVEYDPANLAGATLLDPTYRGWAQLVVEPSSRRLRGATFVGPGASELLYAATLAITTAVDLRHLWSVVPPFPTVSEVWLRLLEAARAQL